MSAQQQALRFGQQRLLRRVGRSLPWIGTLVALAAIGATMRRKGVVRGGVDTALNAIPFVGTLKNVVEFARGRDFIRDRQVTRQD